MQAPATPEVTVDFTMRQNEPQRADVMVQSRRSHGSPCEIFIIGSLHTKERCDSARDAQLGIYEDSPFAIDIRHAATNHIAMIEPMTRCNKANVNVVCI